METEKPGEKLDHFLRSFWLDFSWILSYPVVFVGIHISQLGRSSLGRAAVPPLFGQWQSETRGVERCNFGLVDFPDSLDKKIEQQSVSDCFPQVENGICW
jgi:hypothetical protein